MKFQKSFPSQLPLKRKKRQAKKSDEEVEEAEPQAPRQGDLDYAGLISASGHCYINPIKPQEPWREPDGQIQLGGLCESAQVDADVEGGL